MTTRIVQISDLHFPARSLSQVEQLRIAIEQRAPDLLVVTGDLTQDGSHGEFAAASAFIAQLPGQKIVLPGNHDIPVPGIVDRIFDPFARFREYFPAQPTFLATPDVILLAFNTAVGLQPRLDWSLGYIVGDRLKAVEELLDEFQGDRLKIVLSHHPFRRHPADPQRSNTSGGERAIRHLCGDRIDIILHGHLHRSSVRHHTDICARPIWEIAANTALSNRQRDGAAGFNLLDVTTDAWRLDNIAWTGDSYQSTGTETAKRAQS